MFSFISWSIFFFASDTHNLRKVRRCLTINEALEYLQTLSDDSSSESEKENNDLVVIPPDPGCFD